MTAPRYVIQPVSGYPRTLWVRTAAEDDVAQVWGETPEEAQRRAEIVREALERIPRVIFGHVHKTGPARACYCEEGADA